MYRTEAMHVCCREFEIYPAYSPRFITSPTIYHQINLSADIKPIISNKNVFLGY